MSGLDSYCYSAGYDHGSGSRGAEPDSIGESIEAAPCTLSESANSSYAEGYRDGMNQ